MRTVPFCLKWRHASDCSSADFPRILVDAYLTIGVVALFVLLAIAVVASLLLRRRPPISRVRAPHQLTSGRLEPNISRLCP